MQELFNKKESREFFLEADRMKIHAKLDVPADSAEKEKLPLVIILHGYTGHMEEDHIAGQARTFCEHGFAALRVELYGHGQSDGDFKEHTVMKWLTQLLYVIDYAAALPWRGNLYLTGHSQGGLTVMLAAAAKGDMLKAVIPLSPAVNIHYGARTGDFLKYSFDPAHIPAEYERDGRVLNGNYLRVAQLLPLEDAIQRTECPILIVHGDEDEAVPIEGSREAVRKYKNAQLKEIPGDTHCYDHHLDQMLKIVTDYLLQMESR